MAEIRDHLRHVRRALAAGAFGSMVALGATPALAEGSVKVECWGTFCAGLTLQQICNKFAAGSQPVQVSCDLIDTQNVGTVRTCGSFACGVYNMSSNTIVSQICGDSGGNDIVVSCR